MSSYCNGQYACNIYLPGPPPWSPLCTHLLSRRLGDMSNRTDSGAFLRGSSEYRNSDLQPYLRQPFLYL
ncbi:hypothetical protein HYQ46_010157 [Verticillium longisporum]|nr:hypothetical protein HYQ46_010157 [Verticillium longisporum]